MYQQVGNHLKFRNIPEISATCGLAIFVENRRSPAAEPFRCINSIFRFGPESEGLLLARALSKVDKGFAALERRRLALSKDGRSTCHSRTVKMPKKWRLSLSFPQRVDLLDACDEYSMLLWHMKIPRGGGFP